MQEERIIDLILQVLQLHCAFVPTQLEPANPSLAIMAELTLQASAIRTASKAKFAITFQENSMIAQQLSDLELNA